MPQLFHLNTEMVVKRRFSVFWCYWDSEVLLYFERPLEKTWETVYVSWFTRLLTVWLFRMFSGRQIEKIRT